MGTVATWYLVMFLHIGSRKGTHQSEQVLVRVLAVDSSDADKPAGTRATSIDVDIVSEQVDSPCWFPTQRRQLQPQRVGSPWSTQTASSLERQLHVITVRIVLQ